MIKKKAFAKLNLNLHISPQKNSSGYHPIHSINTQLALYDELIFEPARRGVEIICDHKEMPRQEDNLVYKAALLMQEMDSQKRGVKITINKNIPIRAGLGGGSSDAAATILALSDLWKVYLSEKQRRRLADALGKDVHYSLSGGVAEIGGDGDKVISLPLNTPKIWLVIIVPRETKPSTGWMYSQIDKTKVGQSMHFIHKIKEAMKTKNKDNFLSYIFNDFQTDVFKRFPTTLAMKRDLEDSGTSSTLLCGSGLSMVGFFTSKAKAFRAQKLLVDKYKNVIISQLN